MYHSITFIDPVGDSIPEDDPRKAHYIKNTFDDWHVVPSSRPLFSMPSVKGKSIDLPGFDGSIDLSEAITGYPVYANRTGNWEFIVLNDYGEWHERYSIIADYIHGREMRAILEDDPGWYYVGRFGLNEWRSEKDWSRIVIEYNVEPYKWSLSASDEPWLWDPFSFENGAILNGVYYNQQTGVLYQGADIANHIEVRGVHDLIFQEDATGRAPLQPIFFSADGKPITIILLRDGGYFLTQNITSGSPAMIPGLVLWRGKWLYDGREVRVRTYTLSNIAHLGLNYRMGRL